MDPNVRMAATARRPVQSKYRNAGKAGGLSSLALLALPGIALATNTPPPSTALPPNTPTIRLSIGTLNSKQGLGIDYVYHNDAGILLYDARQSSRPAPSGPRPWLSAEWMLTPENTLGVDYLSTQGSGKGRLRARAKTGPISFLIATGMSTHHEKAEAHFWVDQRIASHWDLTFKPRAGLQWLRLRRMEANAPDVAQNWSDHGSAALPTLGLTIQKNWAQWQLIWTVDHGIGWQEDARGSSRSMILEASTALGEGWRLHVGKISRQVHVHSHGLDEDFNNYQFLSSATWKLRGGYLKLSYNF